MHENFAEEFLIFSLKKSKKKTRSTIEPQMLCLAPKERPDVRRRYDHAQ
jgi:hypothetical protein